MAVFLFLFLFVGSVFGGGAWYPFQGIVETYATNGNNAPTAMPVAQRIDVVLGGYHPTLIAVVSIQASLSLPMTAPPCRTLAVELPLLRQWATTPTPGPAHWYLWDAIKGPPAGMTAYAALTSTIESWVDSSGPTNGWAHVQPVQYYRWLHNLTQVSSMDYQSSPGGMYYLGLYIEQAGYTTGSLDWVASTPPPAPTPPPMLYCDAYGNFLINQTNQSQGQILFTTAPRATSYYTLLGAPVTNLAVRAWAWCNGTGANSGAGGGLASLPQPGAGLPPAPAPSSPAPVPSAPSPSPTPPPPSPTPVPVPPSPPPPSTPVVFSPPPPPSTPMPPPSLPSPLPPTPTPDSPITLPFFTAVPPPPSTLASFSPSSTPTVLVNDSSLSVPTPSSPHTIDLNLPIYVLVLVVVALILILSAIIAVFICRQRRRHVTQPVQEYIQTNTESSTALNGDHDDGDEAGIELDDSVALDSDEFAERDRREGAADPRASAAPPPSPITAAYDTPRDQKKSGMTVVPLASDDEAKK